MSKRVIFVDDSKVILATAQLALKDMVNSNQIKVQTYLNPAELLTKLVDGEESYDLLISDVNMPQLNGLDLAQQLKIHNKFKTKPVLIMTTESSAEMKAKGKEIGVTGWIVKPFNNKKLISAIVMILGI